MDNAPTSLSQPIAVPGLSRPLRLCPGGTRLDDVRALSRALAELLGGTPVAGGEQVPVLVPVSACEDVEALLARIEALARCLPSTADVLLRTSGSTSGQGSVVAMRAEALRASAQATHECLHGPGQWVLALPAHHVAGVQVLVRSVLAGTEPVVVDTSEGFVPAALAEGVEQALAEAGERLPVYVSLVPTQLARCLEDPRAVAAVAQASAVLVGGAATHARLHARALEAGVAVVRTYGMSETGGGCVYDGRALDRVGVRIEDPDAQGVGRIVLSGPMLAEAVCGSSSGDGGGGVARLRGGPWGRELLTADRGRLDAGVLTVVGRVDDVIVTGGVKVEPRVVEAALREVAGVADACVVGVPHARWGQAVVAAVVPAPGHRLQPEEVRAAARRRLDGAHSPKAVEVVQALPERGPGKVDRRAVAAMMGRSSQVRRAR